MTGWVIHVLSPTKDGPKPSTTSLITSREELDASLVALRAWTQRGRGIEVVGVSRVTLKGEGA